MSEKKLTPMQELINEMKKSPLMFAPAILLAQSFLEKEKKQAKETFTQSRAIVSFCPNWNCSGRETKWKSFEDYYNKTFKIDE